MTSSGPGPQEAPFGRPTAIELLEAAAGSLDEVAATVDDAARRKLRVVAHVVRLVGRELELGPELAAAHRDRLASLGVTDDRELVDLVRSATALGLEQLRPLLRDETVGRLRIASPGWLELTVHTNVDGLFAELGDP